MVGFVAISSPLRCCLSANNTFISTTAISTHLSPCGFQEFWSCARKQAETKCHFFLCNTGHLLTSNSIPNYFPFTFSFQLYGPPHYSWTNHATPALKTLTLYSLCGIHFSWYPHDFSLAHFMFCFAQKSFYMRLILKVQATLIPSSPCPVLLFLFSMALFTNYDSIQLTYCFITVYHCFSSQCLRI